MIPSDRRLAGTAPLTVAATFTLLTLAACGGGGGGGDGGKMPTGNVTDNTDSRTVFYGVPSTVAETAARSAPRLGSVTQSSNAADGVTLDAGSIDHAANGDLILRVSRENGASREVSTGGNVALLDVFNAPQTGDYPLFPNDSFYDVRLRNRADGTFVSMLTTRRADLVPASGARVLREGDPIESEFDWESVSGYHETEFLTGNRRVGVYCVSETGSCRVEDSRVVEGTVYLNDGGPAAVVRNWDSNDTDYLAFGSWLRPASSGATQPEVGVFVDGGRPFSASEFTTLTGTATYAGLADAFALGDSNAADVAPFLLPSSEGEGWMQLTGTVELTADFGARAIEGAVTLFGDPDNYDTPGEPEEPRPIVLNLGRAPIDTAQRGGFFVGNTASSGSSSVSGLAGKWGGQFYGAPGDGGRPPYAAGTFGARRNGFSVLGGFFARDGIAVDDLDDFLTQPPEAAPEAPPG